MKLTRVYRFSASHRLHSADLTADENYELYGKCNNPFGHGHDYAIHVTVSGPPDPATGRVVSLGELDRFVSARLLQVYDHKDLNNDVPGFEGVPTTENLVRDAERRLCSEWPFGSVRLHGIRLQETARNGFELRIS